MPAATPTTTPPPTPTSTIAQYVPIVGWLPRYRRMYLRGDIVAGLAVASVAIPTAMGYSTVADVPVQVGLYALPAALILYAIFGSSRQVSIGPTSTVAIMSGAVVFDIVGRDDPAKATALTAGVAISAGLFLAFIGVLRLGWVTDFISRPVITGFSIGLSLVVIVGELPHLLGIPVTTPQFVPRLMQSLTQLPQTDIHTLILGVIALAIVFVGPLLSRAIPWALILMAVGIAVAVFLPAVEEGVEVLGAIPPGLPSFSVPSITAADAGTILLGGLAVAIAGVGEGLSAARLFAAQGGYRVNSDQEFFGTGMSNIASGFTGGMSVTGSLSRTSTAAMSGARTQVSSFVTVACVLLVLVALTGVLANVPRVVLSAIVIASVWPLLDWPTLNRYRKARTVDLVAALTGLLGVLLFGPLYGLLAAVAISVVGITFRSSRVTIDELGRIPGEVAGWGAIVEHPNRVTEHGVAVLRLNTPLFWANAARAHDAVLEFVDSHPDTRVVVLDLEASSQMDSTTSDALVSLVNELRAGEIDLYIARLHYQARRVLDRTGFTELLGEGHMWHSISQTVRVAGESLPR
ncbi:MAG: SulP family inorganic anion transporter [Candidatus Nanopelagicales bacterium]